MNEKKLVVVCNVTKHMFDIIYYRNMANTANGEKERQKSLTIN